MTRAAFLIAMALSAAAVAAQEPPPLPLPGTESKPETKKEKKEAAPLLPLPGIEAPKPAPTVPLPLPVAPKPPEASKAPPAAPKQPATTTVKAVPAVERQAAPAAEKPAPRAAATVAQIGDLRLRPAPDTDLWGVRAFVGGERSTEQDYTDAASHSRLGAEVTRWFSGSWLARGEFDWRSSTQTYVPLHSAVNAPVKVDENRFDVLATMGYDLGPAILRDGRLEFTPMLGVAYVGIRNQAFPSDLIGPNFGGRVRFALSSAVILHATLAYTFNLAVASVQNSALRSPKGDFNTRAGLALPLSGGYALEIDYSGDVLAFENAYRTAHGAALGFGTSF